MPTLTPKLISRFPTYFLQTNLAQEVNLDAIRDGIETMCDEIHNYTTYHHQRRNSNEQFMAINGMLGLRDNILAHALAYAKAVNIKIKESAQVSMWGNRYRSGDQHEYHNHPNSLISGTFYVYTDEESGAIIFQDPAMPMRMFDRAVDSNSRHMYDGKTPHYNTWETVPEPGTLLMWPSYILHRVRQQKRSERVSISFNIDP